MYSKYQAIKDIFEVEEVEIKLTKHDTKIKYSALLDTISKEEYSISSELNVSAGTVSSILSMLFPDRPKTNRKVCTYLLNKYDLKYCSKCKEVKTLDIFSKNSARPGGYNSHCKSCYTETTRDYQREYQKTRKANKLQRTPSWADIEKIKEIYTNCPPGYHVDHIVPLQGLTVCGFHVEYNLQYLTAKDNLTKHNKLLE